MGIIVENCTFRFEDTRGGQTGKALDGCQTCCCFKNASRGIFFRQLLLFGASGLCRTAAIHYQVSNKKPMEMQSSTLKQLFLNRMYITSFYLSGLRPGNEFCFRIRSFCYPIWMILQVYNQYNASDHGAKLYGHPEHLSEDIR